MQTIMTPERVIALALQEGAITEAEADAALLDLARRLRRQAQPVAND